MMVFMRSLAGMVSNAKLERRNLHAHHVAGHRRRAGIAGVAHVEEQDGELLLRIETK